MVDAKNTLTEETWFPYFCSFCPFSTSGRLPDDFEYMCASDPKYLCENKENYHEAIIAYRIKRKLQRKKIIEKLKKEQNNEQ